MVTRWIRIQEEPSSNPGADKQYVTQLYKYTALWYTPKVPKGRMTIEAVEYSRLVFIQLI